MKFSFIFSFFFFHCCLLICFFSYIFFSLLVSFPFFLLLALSLSFVRLCDSSISCSNKDNSELCLPITKYNMSYSTEPYPKVLIQKNDFICLWVIQLLVNQVLFIAAHTVESQLARDKPIG